MEWEKFFNGVAQVAGHGIKCAQILGLMRMHRDVAIRHLQLVVETSTPEQLEAYEEDLLGYFGALLLPSQRVRAMELYAALKIAEGMHYNQFRDFIRSGEPVA